MSGENDRGRGAEASAEESEAFVVRLNAVERRNLHLINDPALEGFLRRGVARVGDAARVDVAGGPGASDIPGASGGPDASGRTGTSDTPGASGGVDARNTSGGHGAQVARRKLMPHRACVQACDAHVAGSFRYVTLPDGTAELTSYEGFSGQVCVPDEVGGHAVSALGRGLFRDHAEIEQVALPRALERIGDHAFDGCALLRCVSLPASLAQIGQLAFAKSELGEIEIPPATQVVRAKAFLACAHLRSCTLHEGLRSLGEEAFAHSALRQVVLPATLEHVGMRAFEDTPAQRTIRTGSVAFGGTRFLLDDEGGLYRRDAASGCVELVELIGRPRSYAVLPGAVRIAQAACKRNLGVRGVTVPEGVTSIGAEAFSGCGHLAKVVLPESLQEIGQRAFLGTALHSLRLSRNVRSVGASALLVQGESPARVKHRLHVLDLDPENPWFYKESGLLCQRGAGHDGGDLCVLYVGPENVVRIPRAVNRIAACAFSGARDIDELFVHGNLHSICRDALSTARSIPLVHVELSLEAKERVQEDFIVPSFSARFRSLTSLFSTDGGATAFNFAYYDSWVMHAADFEEFAPAAAARLAHPVCLSARSRDLYLGIFKRKQDKACAFFARRGNMGALELLCDERVLEREAALRELERATQAHETQTTACLLELARRRGWHARVDLSI